MHEAEGFEMAMKFKRGDAGAVVLASALGVGLCLLAPATHAAAAAAGSGIAWVHAASDAEVDKAFEIGRKSGKPVFLYWGAVWCPPCNQVKATLFSRPDFVERSRAFVPVYVDGDKAGAQDPLAGSPAFDFVTGAGGFTQVFTHGLTGFRWRPDEVYLDPMLPPQLSGGVTLSGLHWQGRTFDVHIGASTTSVVAGISRWLTKVRNSASMAVTLSCEIAIGIGHAAAVTGSGLTT
jgi:hypothetical protein